MGAPETEDADSIRKLYTDGFLKKTKGSGFTKKNNSEIQEIDNGEIWLCATKPIKKGDEIFCSYGTRYWTNWFKRQEESKSK